MKTLYIDCSMGAAGDMLMASLFELIDDQEGFLSKINSIVPEGIKVSASKEMKCGIQGTHMSVKIHGVEEAPCCDAHHAALSHGGNHGEPGHHDAHGHGSDELNHGAHSHGEPGHHATHGHCDAHDEFGHCNHAHSHGGFGQHVHSGEHSHGKEHAPGHHHHCEGHHHNHSGIHDIEHIIDAMDISEKVKKDAKNVYGIIAQAEARVHGKTLDNIHFHEVGTLDAVCDVVGNCMLMEKLGVDKVIVSPVHVGSGTVKCAHGVLPVPAPATALILEGVPAYGGEVKGEMCTPTGAALIKYFADEFGPMPAMISEKIGYGLGTKDFAERANCLRATLGSRIDHSAKVDYVCELAVNLDDMTGEDIGFAMEILMEKGALDVYLEHIVMKKSRPAVKLVCICKEAESEKFAKLILKYTTSIGVRQYRCKRFVLDRDFETKDKDLGQVRYKHSKGYGVEKAKAEHDDVAKLARKMDKSPMEIRELINREI